MSIKQKPYYPVGNAENRLCCWPVLSIVTACRIVRPLASTRSRWPLVRRASVHGPSICVTWGVSLEWPVRTRGLELVTQFRSCWFQQRCWAVGRAGGGPCQCRSLTRSSGVGAASSLHNHRQWASARPPLRRSPRVMPTQKFHILVGIVRTVEPLGSPSWPSIKH